MYRLMLVAKIFPVDNYEDEDEEDEAFDPAEVERDRLLRKKLLDDFPTSELFELQSASLFLIEIAKGIRAGENGQPEEMFGDVVLARGPALVLQAYQFITTGDLVGYLEIVPPSLVSYLSNPLERILEERKTKPPDNSSHWSSLLDDVRGGNDMCKFPFIFGCGWDDLRRFSISLGLCGIVGLVKGHLIANIVEGSSLRNELLEAHSSPTSTNLLEQMHQVKTPPWDTWNNGDWLCEPCIVELFQAHLHLWLLERKREKGDEIKEDCWYGYNCRTQRHSVHHAGRLNHLCEPTR
ncbi:hypothetical protein C0995_000141 [Termitomyces sp. Mi166|nr:hypothetical protein C0995_000141 [Termitomyces sp. Mi166\